MRKSFLLPLLCLLAVPLMALTCNPVPTIIIVSPAPLAQETSCSVDLEFAMVGAFSGPPTVLLNFQPLSVTLSETAPGYFTATIGPEDGLDDSNILLVKGQRASDGKVLTQGVSFDHRPPAQAYQITNPADLLTGPLAHNRVGDYMLESCVARFVIQDGAQRDLYSVGQYGGNLIDAERIGRPGLDNFLEVQAMANVETVINAQTVYIQNDGGDGNPAVVRACGPDDLLDFVNPSSQVTDLNLPFPAVLNDNDQTVQGCTDYELAGRDSHIRMVTTLTNDGAAPISVLSGDWMNQGGELHVVQVPNKGVGPALTNALGAMSFFGYGEATGVDYAYTTDTPPTPGSYVVISGVTVILYSNDVLQALLGLQGGVNLDPTESHVMTRYFGVGDGSPSNAVDLDLAVHGDNTAHIEGCVTTIGLPLPGAKITVGTFDLSGNITALATHFVTDSTGCYSGDVPVPTSPIDYGIVAAKEGLRYVGLAATPSIVTRSFTPGSSETVDFALPVSGNLKVTVTDQDSAALPSRVTVVGFDKSPPITFAGPSLPGFGGSTLALFNDPDDSLPFGIVRAVHTGADGIAQFPVEPGNYRVVVSRGTEYSIADIAVTISPLASTQITAQLVHVLDTDGFVSSDFHVHGINSADSKVSDKDRVEGYAGEGVDNIIMTDHHVHTDLSGKIAALGLGQWVSSTIGEEITTFDYGHFNAYPLLQDLTRISKGSTDWAVAAPPGQEFPSAGAFNATPAEIYTLATTGPNATLGTTIQINHIDSHFAPLKIDTSLIPPQDGLDAAARLERRLDEPITTNLFFPFPALELWNGDSRGAQSNFLDERIGIWFNLLNQGIETTFIADTDSHRYTNLGMAGARTWTAAAPGSDAPGTVDGSEVGAMVTAGRAVGGQGIFVTTSLRATDGSGDVADLTRFGDNHMTDSFGNVELDIRVQAPTWARFDTIEIYANAATTPVDATNPYLYTAAPSLTLSEGDCLASTTGDGQFDLTLVNVAAIPGGDRYEVNLTVPFNNLTADTWFVVLVRGSDGACPAMFPVFAAGLNPGSNTTLPSLLDGNVGEGGVLALGATNALYFDAP